MQTVKKKTLEVILPHHSLTICDVTATLRDLVNNNKSVSPSAPRPSEFLFLLVLNAPLSI